MFCVPYCSMARSQQSNSNILKNCVWFGTVSNFHWMIDELKSTNLRQIFHLNSFVWCMGGGGGSTCLGLGHYFVNLRLFNSLKFKWIKFIQLNWNGFWVHFFLRCIMNEIRADVSKYNLNLIKLVSLLFFFN